LTSSHTERIEQENLGQSPAQHFQGRRRLTTFCGQNVPRSDLNLLAQKLNASFIKQQSCSVTIIDKIRAKFAGTPQNWAYARSLSSQLGSQDVVFCPGEEIGIPLASICSQKQKRPKIVVWFHRITGLRTRVALKLFKISSAIDLAVVSNCTNRDFLHNYLNLPLEQILFWWHPIDSRFFTPGLGSDSKTKPIIASIGLEYRDYRLLAAATEKLDVDVKVAGFSQFQSRVAKSFPQVLPNNMTNKNYQWSELIELYHHADVIVIPLQENNSAAGVTVLLEAMSCKKPIVCIRTKGLKDYLSDEKAVSIVEPEDITGLQQAITTLLDRPEIGKKMAQRAFELVNKKHNLEQQVQVLTRFIKTLEF